MPSESFFNLERPLHLLPEIGQVRAANLQQFPELVRRLGGDHVELLSRNDLPLLLLKDTDSYIDCQTLVNLYEDCSTRLQDPLFGLHLAALQVPDVYGGVLALCRSAATLRDSLSCLIEFLPITHCSESLLTLHETADVVELCWSELSNFGNNTQANFQGMYLNLQVLKTVGGPSFIPRYALLPPAVTQQYRQEIEEILGCPVRICADKSGIAFDRNYLDAPVASANAPLFQLLYGYMYRLKTHARQTVMERVHEFVARTLGINNVSIEACAQELKLSPRTLQMRLKCAGKTYTDILEYHRLERAKYVLSNSKLPIPEVADSLGYAERTSFGRAFKRWTGFSPQQYRQRYSAGG